MFRDGLLTTKGSAAACVCIYLRRAEDSMKPEVKAHSLLQPSKTNALTSAIMKTETEEEAPARHFPSQQARTVPGHGGERQK